ncbi:MAG: hypothetical protein LBG14_03785, partial [Treponema sp.]|nr:hypothetical protein [Treponema sp.]
MIESGYGQPAPGHRLYFPPLFLYSKVMDAINIQEPVNPADEIWAILRETDRILKENALKMEETDRRMK